MRRNSSAMRDEIMGVLAEVLSEDQVDSLKEHMKEMQERRGQFGGGPRGGGGGAGGGGF